MTPKPKSQPKPKKKPDAPRRCVLDIGKWISMALTAEKYGFALVEDVECKAKGGAK